MEKKSTASVKYPKTLVEAVRVFSDLNYATMFFAAIRWPDGVRCPHCGSEHVDYIEHRRVWQCRGNHSRSQFSVKIGTIFEECRLTIDKCLIAIWLEVNAKNSISSYEVARHLGCTQKTGWFLLHRVRHALKQGTFNKIGGKGEIVEADETFVGGLAKNMHKERRAKLRGTSGVDKTPVMGVLVRGDEDAHSEVRAVVLDNVQKQSLHDVIHKNVEPGSQVFTDAFRAYQSLDPKFFHDFVDHVQTYAKGAVHTNGLENFWSLFKRCIKGTHISIEPFHLAAYVDSEAFRFNNRKIGDGGRFLGALRGVEGKRLTYKALIGSDESEGAQGSDRDAGKGKLPN